jgi:hypothetical protein
MLAPVAFLTGLGQGPVYKLTQTFDFQLDSYSNNHGGLHSSEDISRKPPLDLLRS